MRIVISGASGSVGSSIIPRLLKEGHTLLLLSRNPAALMEKYPGVLSESLWTWTSLASGFDCFVHLAVLNNDQRATENDYLQVNGKLTDNLAEAAKKAGIPRFIYPSTVLNLLGGPPSPYTKSKSVGEEQALKHYGESLEIVYLGLTRKSRSLSFLDRLPRTLASIVFRGISAFKPTTSAETFTRFITEQGVRHDLREILTENQSDNKIYRAWRTLLDWTFVVVVSLSIPVLCLIWGLVVIDDGAPGFFRQNRVGQNLKTFQCYKFRTMRNGTQSTGTHHVPKDRITRIGLNLRRLKLDELPQALNIARGEMSIIGPRPSLPEQADVVQARREAGVHTIRPGITGWSQVRAINMETPHELASVDFEYMRLRCIWLDLRILLKTLKLC